MIYIRNLALLRRCAQINLIAHSGIALLRRARSTCARCGADYAVFDSKVTIDWGKAEGRSLAGKDADRAFALDGIEADLCRVLDDGLGEQVAVLLGEDLHLVGSFGSIGEIDVGGHAGGHRPVMVGVNWTKLALELVVVSRLLGHLFICGLIVLTRGHECCSTR